MCSNLCQIICPNLNLKIILYCEVFIMHKFFMNLEFEYTLVFVCGFIWTEAETLTVNMQVGEGENLTIKQLFSV